MERSERNSLQPRFIFCLQKKYWFLLFLYSQVSFFSTGQILNNSRDAFQFANAQQRAVLLVFSGSDWCLPCIRFNKTILSDTVFCRFAQQQLIILNADFPQRKKLPAAVITQNEALASRYNPEGAFPKLVLLRPDQSVLAVLTYNNQPPGLFIEQISSYLHAANMLKEYSIQTKLMGSAFEFIVCAGNKKEGDHWLTESIRETKRIETLLTEFSETSQTALINNNAGINPVTVDEEVYALIKRCHHISQLCNGSFDITAGALKKLYNFKGEHFVLPSKKVIQETIAKTGFTSIKLLPENKIFLSVRGMKISFAAIGKGYAGDKVKELLQTNGITGGVVNASGDLTAWGTRANGDPWKTGIASPDHPGQIIVWLPVNGLSVATSGNYIHYFDVNGIRYSHTIDPKSGYPVRGIKSVTIVSPSAELSDSLATAVTVMGVKQGLHFINQLPQTYCLIVDEQNAIHCSKQLNIQSNT